jgi:hypothetical protein
MPSTTELTVLDTIKSVLPDGTRQPKKWDTVCKWPPDLFAAVATITERSGLYSEKAFMAYWVEGFCLSNKWIEETRALGQEWAASINPPRQVERLWSQLIHSYGNARITDPSEETPDWKKIVFQLLAVADEACAGVGFSPVGNPASGAENVVSTIQYMVADDYIAWEEKRQENPDATVIGGVLLPYLPHSLCIRVPPAIACVQPKTSTPVVGCTLRSLTHHIALLPSIGNVTTHWLIANKSHEELHEGDHESEGNGAFNLLVVPFPFFLPGKSFAKIDGRFPGGPNERAFTLNPDAWMNQATPLEFADFLLGLVEAAAPELEPVHAIVLPETALRLNFANQVAEILASRSALDLFITGVVAGKGKDPRNSAAIYRFFDKDVISASFQSKHHRWLLNKDQIRRYHLGHVLDPSCKWWEQIDVSYRHCYVTLFRSQATVSVLICEDLARYDPVLTVMNAIGPNLVIALLMDGPQLEQRWPGRYATVLADDPGSAVLTVTSLGMVLRSAMPGEPENREIALWKEPNGRARSLKLPKGDHALLVTLTNDWVEQFTLDGRSDGATTLEFALGAAHGVRYRGSLPNWVGFKD